MIPFIELKIQDVALRQEIDAAFRRIVDGAAFIGGEEVDAFAREFGAYAGGGTCVPVANGTDALILALRALDLKPGDEVITVPFTFIASAEAVTAAGGRVRFVDVEADTFTIDVRKAAAAVTAKTKAILPVHLFGQTADMDAVNALARDHGLAVVEDAAQAHGAAYRGRRAGALGDMACFSFYPTKNLGGFGDGGAVVCATPERAERVARLANHGRSGQYFHVEEGVNSRLDALQAAVLRLKLKRLDTWNARRRDIARAYDRALAQVPSVRPPTVRPEREHVYHLYTVTTDRRDELMAHLKSSGVACGAYYPHPLHRLPAYAYLGHGDGDFPVSERLARTVLSLPMHPFLSDGEVERVCAALRAWGG